jgi:FkbM family methyltransferase
MNFENLIQECFLNLEDKTLTLLQIGANDGQQSDPFRESIIKYQINSHLLEPIPEFYNMLINNYSKYDWVKCYNLAITNKDGEDEIKYVPRIDSLPEWTQGLGTFDSSKNFLRAGKGGNGLKEDFSTTEIYNTVKNNIKTTIVKTNTLETFIKKININQIDIYTSDTEGFDWIIFNQLDLNRFNPKIIFMETHTLGEEQNLLIDNKLIKYGYTILDKTWDTIAIKK